MELIRSNRFWLYRLEYSPEQEMFHIQHPGEFEQSNGYVIIHASDDYDLLFEIKHLCRKTLSHPLKLSEIERTAEWYLREINNLKTY